MNELLKVSNKEISSKSVADKTDVPLQSTFAVIVGISSLNFVPTSFDRACDI